MEKEYTKKELVKLAQKYRDNAKTIVDIFMAKDSLDFRYNYINEVTSTLYSKYWDSSFKDFWSKNNKFKRKEMWQTFIAAEQIKGDKTKLVTSIATARMALTCSSAERVDIIYDYIKKLDGIIPPNDTEGLNIIKKLEWFARHPDALRNDNELFINEIAKLKNYKIKTIDENLAQAQEDCKKNYIDIIENLLDENATGELQDMLSIYYKIAPFKLDKSGGLIAVKKAVKSFDKSVELEGVEFFDKIRDLRLGSAPTDILTLVFSFLALSFGFGYAKDKDKKVSVVLKSGIPIVGGIATTIYTTTKLVSGGKSLALGFLSGIILNQLGKIADNVRINSKNKMEA